MPKVSTAAVTSHLIPQNKKEAKNATLPFVDETPSFLDKELVKKVVHNWLHEFPVPPMRPKHMIDIMFALMEKLTKVDARWKAVTPSMMNTGRPRYRSLYSTFKKLENSFSPGGEEPEYKDNVKDQPPVKMMEAKEPPKSILRKRVTFPAPEK
jgi:hypothetical protein